MATDELSLGSSSPIIETEGLLVSLSSHPVLHGLDFIVRRGEFVSIVGKTGVGKSTMLHALAGFIPFEGRVVVPERFGFVFQSDGVFPFLTVVGNLKLGIHGLSNDAKSKRVGEFLRLVEMEEQSNRYPGQLSGGQVQRVALARALAAYPSADVIFCDEPFGALDVFTREKMQDLLRRITMQRRVTVVFVTHSIDEAIFLSSRVLVMADGRFVGEVRIEQGLQAAPDFRFGQKFLDIKRTVLNLMGESN